MEISRLRSLRRPIGCSNEAVRDAWVRDALKKVPPGKKILDAGAGTQPYRAHCRHLIYVSQDFGQYDGVGDRNGLQTGEFHYGKLDIVSDITAIPEGDNCFDVILCTEVLEHIPKPDMALRELIRLLKPGGDLLFTAPFVSFTHFAPYHFCTGFNRYFYEHHLGANGMDILEIAANGGFFDIVAQEVRRTGAIAERYANSRLSLIERIAQKIFLRGLSRLQERDCKSWEFACFGLHVHARKRPKS